ncbi:uncharacterized protein BXZ73DRAFT_62717, partial [Epithele typhae]|uniref:uncharacterized protein n=1 Tax=Epithele typhae TaxID=378194 RepID=UPI002008A176
VIACMKFLGEFPCPGCLVKKSDIDKMGTIRDMAARQSKPRKDSSPLRRAIGTVREWIFRDGDTPESKRIKVKKELATTSTQPTQSAFSVRFAGDDNFDFNVYDLFVPDLMHEFELGVWKATFTHLLRILFACEVQSAVQRLDKRYALIPSFARSTIRPFTRNTSAMKKLAARDFEQILKCAIPAFEGLLQEADPEHETIVSVMLFELCQWHSLAKLRLHSETTLRIFEASTRSLGQIMRQFKRDVCSQYVTKELPRETQSRAARARKKATKSTSDTTAQEPGRTASKTAPGPKRKEFNLNTYKYHRLGDYVIIIRIFGTTDNTTTQTGEQEHRRVKKFYGRTNKNRAFGQQLGAEVRREAILHKLASVPNAAARARSRRRQGQKRAAMADEKRRQSKIRLQQAQHQPLSQSSPKQRYHMSDDQHFPVDLHEFVSGNTNDPASEDFELNLKTHVFSVLSARHAGRNLPGSYEPTPADVRSVRIAGPDRLYVHKVLRINYTTYDMRRDMDSINPRTHPDIMLLAPEGSRHPYIYARVIGLYHVNAYLVGESLSGADDTEPELVPLVWVRWYEADSSPRRTRVGLASRRLPCLKWAPLDSKPFGFIYPEDIIRSAHIIPSFHSGVDNASPIPCNSLARHDDNDMDYEAYHVGIFADRDMFMRYLGGGVGHQHCSIPYNEQLVEDAGEQDGETLIGPSANEAQREADDAEHAEADDRDARSETDEAVDYGYGIEDGKDRDDDDSDDDDDGNGDGEDDDEASRGADLGPEDGEDIMGVDEFETGAAGFDRL